MNKDNNAKMISNKRKANTLFYIGSITKLFIITFFAYLVGAFLAQKSQANSHHANMINCITQLQGPNTSSKPSALNTANTKEPTVPKTALSSKKPKNDEDLLPTTTEFKLMAHILNLHYSAEGIDHKNVPLANENFFKIIDPFGFLITEEELARFAKINSEEANKLVIDTYVKGKNSFYLNISQEVRSRLSQLVKHFSENKDFRKEVKEMAEVMALNLEEKKISRPKTTKELINSFKRLLAKAIVYIMNSSQYYSNSGSKKIDAHGAFLIMLRELRPVMVNHLMTLHPKNLPYLIVNAYAKTLDPYTNLFLPEEMQAWTNRTSGEFIGIGVDTIPHAKGFEIIDTVKGGSADTFGLQKGDIITHIQLQENDELPPQIDFIKHIAKYNWVNLRSLSNKEVIPVLRGKENNPVVLRVLRGDQYYEFTIPRKAILKEEQLINIEIKSTDQGQIAYVIFDTFYRDSAKQLRAKILEIKSKYSISAIVFDVRGNLGGSTDELVEILGFFIPKGLAMHTEGKIKRAQLKIPPNNKPIWDGPLVILTDAESASASEALTQSLKDYKRALVIGDSTTYGKGSQQTIIPMGNFGIKVTDSLYYTAGGLSPQFAGVPSDIVLPYSIFDGYKFERDHPLAIQPKPINLKVSEKILNQVAIPGFDKIKEELKKLSLQRNAHVVSSKRTVKSNSQSIDTADENLSDTSNNGNLSDEEKYDFNTQESIKITEDFIRLLGDIK